MDSWDKYIADAKAREKKRVEARIAAQNKRLKGEREALEKQVATYTAKKLAQQDRQARARSVRMKAETKTLKTKSYKQLFGQTEKATTRVIWPYEIPTPAKEDYIFFSDAQLFTMKEKVVTFVNSVDSAVGTANQEYKITTRLAGALQALGGGLTAAGSATLFVGSAVTCPETGVACLGVPVATAGMGMGSDQFIAGIKTVWHGESQSTLTGKAITATTGISPAKAELAAGLMTLSPAIYEVHIYNQATKAMAATNAWVRGTYNGTSHIAHDGKVYRYVEPKYANESSWRIQPQNVGANHRYTGPGTGGLYVGTAEKTAAAEVKSYPKELPTGEILTGEQTLATKVLIVNNVKISNILDLTNPIARQGLNTTIKGITDASHGGSAYVSPQRITEWAISQGYKGILFPSAQRPKVHLTSFYLIHLTEAIL